MESALCQAGRSEPINKHGNADIHGGDKRQDGKCDQE